MFRLSLYKACANTTPWYTSDPTEAFPLSVGIWPVLRGGLPGITWGQGKLHHIWDMRATASPWVPRNWLSVRIGYVSHATHTSRFAWFRGSLPSIMSVLSQAPVSRRDCRATGTMTARTAQMKTATPDTSPAVPSTFKTTSRGGRRDTGKRGRVEECVEE